MRAVPVLQALSWGEESPLLPSGEVDTAALASLNDAGRRGLATRVWVAGVRDAGSRENRAGKAKDLAAIRTMDVDAFAAALGRLSRSDAPRGGAYGLPPGVVAVEASLKSLGALEAAKRRQLSLYGLLAEAVLAGLGTAVAEAALANAGLAPDAPELWVDALRFARRMAASAVRRDLPGAIGDGDRAFPAMDAKILAMDPDEAQKRWISRYRALTRPRREDES